MTAFASLAHRIASIVVTQAPCSPSCPICTDTTPPQDWNGPYTAYRWSPEVEERE